NCRSVCDQLGWWSVHQLRPCDLVDHRRRMVVVYGIELVSSSPVVADAALAQLLDLHHLQCDSSFQRRRRALDWIARVFDVGSELGRTQSAPHRTERGSAGSTALTRLDY